MQAFMQQHGYEQQAEDEAPEYAKVIIRAKRLSSILLKIDTLYIGGIYPQEVMRFSQLIFRPKNIPQVEQNIVSFGLDSSCVRGKEGHMRTIEGP